VGADEPAACAAEVGGGDISGDTAHAASTPRIAAPAVVRIPPEHRVAMWIILLEAFAALAVLVLIVWWTMFCGRSRGERRRPPHE
jgi:cyanate permease